MGSFRSSRSVITRSVKISQPLPRWELAWWVQAAEKNIDEKLAEMNLLFQQQRQEEITGELIDIIAGYQAM